MFSNDPVNVSNPQAGVRHPSEGSYWDEIRKEAHPILTADRERTHSGASIPPVPPPTTSTARHNTTWDSQCLGTTLQPWDTQIDTWATCAIFSLVGHQRIMASHHLFNLMSSLFHPQISPLLWVVCHMVSVSFQGFPLHQVCHPVPTRATAQSPWSLGTRPVCPVPHMFASFCKVLCLTFHQQDDV